MYTAPSKEPIQKGAHAPQHLHEQAAEHHEQAAKHHKTAANCCASGDMDGADHHARSAQGHAVHAGAHWIDHKSLPETSGTISKILYNLHGDSDGFLLDGDRQVHFPPHMSADLLKAVKVGEKIKVHAVKPRAADVLVAAAVTSASGTVVVDHGPDPKKH
ncbi:MAG: hypothetical protein QE279_00550 [Rhodoferax sp.]|jgi:exopolyphosphatase/pppGpp-phosphohydrolase|nr:hypothetical protein [Rhodoferax sp.]